MGVEVGEKKYSVRKSALFQRVISKWTRRRLLVHSIVIATIILLLNNLWNTGFQILGHERLQLHTSTQSVWDALKEVPKPDVTSEMWIGQQASLYQRLREMRRLRQQLPGYTDPKLRGAMDEDLRQLERTAFSFMLSPPAKGDISGSLGRILDVTKKTPYGRGIVMVGGDRQYRFLLHLIGTLRHIIKSVLPIEVFYRGSKDLSSEQINALESFENVVVKDLIASTSGIFNETEAGMKTATFALKPFALLASSFEEAILVDADTIFFQDPVRMYDDAGYKETGTLFFHDRKYPGYPLRKWMREQIELTGVQPSEQLKRTKWWGLNFNGNWQESGVVVIDKRREDVLLSFMFVTWLNSFKQRNTTRKIMAGDKETFWLAYELTRQPYSFIPEYAGSLGIVNQTSNLMEVDNMLHCDRDQKPLWLNGGLYDSKHKKNSELLEATHIGKGDGQWAYHVPKWTYKRATWLPAGDLERLLRRMTALAQELNDRYKPKEYL